MLVIIDLRDHNNESHKDGKLEFPDQPTVRQLQDGVKSVCRIEPIHQQIFGSDNRRIDLLGSSDAAGITNGERLQVKHSFAAQWPNYLLMVQDFRDADIPDKQRLARRANEKSIELETEKFFNAYTRYENEWLRVQKEYATFLDTVSEFIREAAKAFFNRKFHDKIIDKIIFEDKKEGTRSGAVCKVTVDEVERVFYVKTNHNATIKSSLRGPLNMVELFIYKFLEVVGVGATIDFIPNTVKSDRIIYICGEQIAGFKTFKSLQDDWTDFERKTVKTRAEFAKRIIELSLLTQLLDLGDMNNENIGFAVQTAQLYIVDFESRFKENRPYDGFENINWPNNSTSLISKLSVNLDRFRDLVKGMGSDEQLSIAKEYSMKIDSSLDTALTQFDHSKDVFQRKALEFNKDRKTGSVKKFVEVVRGRIDTIIRRGSARKDDEIMSA